MQTIGNDVKRSMTYYRLVAVWVLCEAMLGGIIHGFKIPVSGLIVGSCAVVCISLIRWYVPSRGGIIKATMIVAIFKMMLSPQSPPPAYIAVFFQGLLGELLLFNKRFFRVGCLLLAILSLIESGMQRIFVLIIVYGTDIWRALNEFISKLTGQKEISNYSLYLSAGYVLLHLITGVMIGWWSGSLPAKIESWKKDELNTIIVNSHKAAEEIIPKHTRKKRLFKRGMIIIWIFLAGLYLQSLSGIGEPVLSSHIAVQIFVRSLLIVLAWYFILGPLFTSWLHGWLQKRKTGLQKDISAVLLLLPQTKLLAIKCWEQTGAFTGLKRLKRFGKLMLTNTMNHTHD
jgi:hypothetical protein